MAYTTDADGVSQGFKGYAGIFTQRRKYDLSDKVIQKSRIAAKLVNIFSKNLTKMAVTELEPRIFEFTEENDVISINNNPGTGTTFSVPNADAQMLQEGDILYVLQANITSAPSQETTVVKSVGAVDSGGAGYTNITVERAHLGGSAINIATGSDYNLIWGGNALAENAGSSQPRTKEPNYTYNYLQLFDKVVGQSKDVENSEFYAKQFFSLDAEAVRKRNMLMRNINWTFYLGQRNKKTSNDGNLKHYTGGIYEVIPTANKHSLAGNMTIQYWNQQTATNWCVKGNERKVKFCAAGPHFMTAVENMFEANGRELRMDQKLSQFYGIQIKTMNFSGGTIHFFREEAFYGTGYSNAAFLLDMDYLTYMYLRNRDIQLDKDATPKDEKFNKTKWILFGRLGLFRTYSEAHHFLYNPS
jgi:hypothetical protein